MQRLYHRLCKMMFRTSLQDMAENCFLGFLIHISTDLQIISKNVTPLTPQAST